MSEVVPAQTGAASARLHGVVVLAPHDALLASIKERLARPWRQARQSLAARIGLAAGGMTLLLVVLGLTVGAAMVTLATSSERSRVLNEAALASAELTSSIADSRYYASRYAATGEGDEIERAGKTLARAKERLELARERSLNTDAQAVEAMEWLRYQVDGFENELGALKNSVARYGPSASGDALAKAIDVSGEQLAEQARGVEKRLAGASESTTARVSRLGWQLVAAVVALLAAGLAVTVVGARFVARTTSHSIREITAAMSALAKGDRHVAVPGTAREDEIGEMARALAVFRKSAQDLATLQEEAARSAREELVRQEMERDRRIRLMHEVASQFEHTVGGIVSGVATASKQLELTASSMAARASQSAQVTGDVSRSIQQSTGGMTAAASVSDQFAASIGEISQQAASSAARAQDARRIVQGADAIVAALANSTGEIETIVGMIDGIAQRTSLLALNASIEAARSGEAGRGFAVVAGEVKALARQTSDATGDVADRIQAIQHATGESIAALRQIAEQVHLLEGSAVAIAQSVDEQMMASKELASNLARAASGADEVGYNMGQVSETADSTGAAAAQVLDAASDLHRQAEVLRGQVDEFLGYVRAA
ncbi:HAMP domain-containing protein [Croceibacterium sp. LX-88]|uniref:HAMP domain-containing protein n=1 Tax=Croceibacterium selenioxidans TaxID=2838833 RepID=A0ABS5W0I5_9SPHN|nr:HAMP domain-containing methyl-accepting chemotaxis protein [Croceibacterium selenioxidans]MBT2133251.1 HAMP domain-containing protein [Croceibacterium selenioxidans]